MSILDLTIQERSLDYVDKLIERPLVSHGHLKLDEFDVKQLSDIVQDSLENFKTTENLASSFGHYTKNWNMDWQWIAFHITQDYYCIRRANELKNLFKRDIKIYKDCINKMDSPEFNKLYLTDWTNPKSAPKVFLLSELAANGSNLGRTKEEWKPVIGVTDFGLYKYHPYGNPEWEEIGHYSDHSHITSISDNDVWDEAEQKFKYGREISKRAKQIAKLIKWTVTDDNGKVIYSSDKQNKDKK